MHYGLVIILLSFISNCAHSQGFYNTTNWRFSNPKKFGFTVIDVNYFDNNNAIAVGIGGIAKTTDGGTNWTYGPFTFVNPAGFIQQASFSNVHFVNANVAYAVGSFGVMAKSTDAGQSWSLVTTPLFANSKNINAVWFINKDTGYIGGQFNNTPDSLPKLYVTRNGGATWDSIAAPPVNGITRCGYINNVNMPSFLLNVDAKAKDIYRIRFINDSVGYVCGTASPLFPGHPAVNTTTCLPNGTNTSTGAHTAALLWKINKGVITDYSISKERIGYTGITVSPVVCGSRFGNISPAAQANPWR